MTPDNPTLRPVLIADAASCAIMGIALLSATDWIARLTGLPPTLLLVAGLIVAATALFIGTVTLRPRIPGWALRLIVWGNAAWILASLIVAVTVPANSLGVLLVITQAAVVAVMTGLEAMHLSRRTAAI